MIVLMFLYMLVRDPLWLLCTILVLGALLAMPWWFSPAPPYIPTATQRQAQEVLQWNLNQRYIPVAPITHPTTTPYMK